MPGNADGEQHVSEVDEGSPGSGSVWLPSAYSSPSQAPPPDITPRSPASTGPFNMAMDVDPVDEDGNSPALEEDGEDEHRREGTAEAPLVDLPYKDQFTVLTDLSAESQPIDSLHPQPVDVDRWELVISPAQYLLRFKDTLATVQLISRAPHRVLHPTYHRGPGFDRWLLLAQANHQLWIDPKYKDPFFNSLEHYQTAQPGRLLLQASLGNVHVSTSVFIHCLRQAGCDTIRLKAYGQKTPLVERFLNKEPAQTDHRWAEHNEWDIGRSFSSPFIWLFASAEGRRHGLKHHPMLVPGSDKYGTVNIKATHRSRHFSVKVYPRIVHVIKSFNSRLQGSVPNSLQGVRNQVAAGLRMIHNLTGKDAMALGGFRIEVTVKAPSLRQAHRLVKATNFLNPSYWLGAAEGPHAALLLTANLVTREGFLANANWVYQQAAQANIFQGRAADAPSKAQIQALIDILNGLGWNGGIRSPTKSLDPNAWWHCTPSTDRSAIFQELSKRYQSDEEFRDLYEQARGSSHPYTLPCKAQPGNPDHRYQVHHRAPFRVRCSQRQCQHKLQRTALVHWIAELIQGRVIDGTALGL
jgi:predicted component of type VI protein secretion system